MPIDADHDPRPELGSVLATLAELNRRVESMATQFQSRETGSRIASDLFAVDASLRSAHRRLDKLIIALGR